MPFLVELAIGCTVFSVLYSLYCFVRFSRREKSDYDRWMEDVQRENIVKPNRDFARTPSVILRS